MTTTTLTAESTSKFVQAGDVKIHYHEAGSGHPLLCIHGGAPGAFGWGNFGRNMEFLSQRFRTFIVDLPGYGKSDKPVIEGGRQAFYARVFRDMIDTLGLEKPHLIGMATGGNTSIKMAIEYPDHLDRLVLVSSAGGISLFSSAPSEGQKIINSYYSAPGPSLDKMKVYLQTIMYNHSLITQDLIDERYNASIEPEFMQSAPEGRPNTPPPVPESVWQDLQKIKAKTLVIWGKENRVQTFDNGLFMLSRIPDVQLHIYGQCGLFVPYEKAAEFNELVAGFLTTP